MVRNGYSCYISCHRMWQKYLLYINVTIRICKETTNKNCLIQSWWHMQGSSLLPSLICGILVKRSVMDTLICHLPRGTKYQGEFSLRLASFLLTSKHRKVFFTWILLDFNPERKGIVLVNVPPRYATFDKSEKIDHFP